MTMLVSTSNKLTEYLSPKYAWDLNMPYPVTFISKPPLSLQLSCAQNASRGASTGNNQTSE